MPISEKILNHINENPVWDEAFKKLLVSVLIAEEQSYRYKKEFDNLVSEYIVEESGGKSNGTNK